MTAWGWRVPFAVGAVIALVGLWIRRTAEETHPDRDGLAAGGRPPLFEALRRYPKASLLVAAVTVAGHRHLLHVRRRTSPPTPRPPPESPQPRP